MKAIIIVLIWLLAAIHALHGQEGRLVLTSKSSSKEHVIESGQIVKVYRSESAHVKGALVLVDSATIAIGKDIIPLSEVNSIQARTPQTQNKGGVLTGIGVLFMLGGVGALMAAKGEKDNSLDFYSGVYDAAGTGLLAIGGVVTGAGIITLAGGKNYKSKTWAYKIRMPGKERP